MRCQESNLARPIPTGIPDSCRLFRFFPVQKHARPYAHNTAAASLRTISNSHLLFHERCNALMRAYYLSK